MKSGFLAIARLVLSSSLTLSALAGMAYAGGAHTGSMPQDDAPPVDTAFKYTLDSVESGVCVKELVVQQSNEHAYMTSGYAPSNLNALTFINVGADFGTVKFERTPNGFSRIYRDRPTWSYLVGDSGKRHFLLNEVRNPRSEKSTWSFSDDGKMLSLEVISKNPSPAWPTPERSLCKYRLESQTPMSSTEFQNTRPDADQTLISR